MFEVAERPEGYWGRSYLATGSLKDSAFQLDQQCYPLLEVVDYTEATGDKTLAKKFEFLIEEILAKILERKAPQAWLFPTSETPADDKVDLSYHFSSNILVWRLFKRLALLEALPNYTPDQLLKMAEQVRNDLYRYMLGEFEGHRLFAYLTDLHGNYRFYHDANDWPTIFAPLWGFCRQEDLTWQNTLSFAFSPANQGGYYAGPYGGLGSVHTPHPWPLGELQELLVANLRGEKERQARIWKKLEKVACWDGMFPEAYDETTGQVASRHWFSWPGSMLVSLIQLITGQKFF